MTTNINFTKLFIYISFLFFFGNTTSLNAQVAGKFNLVFANHLSKSFYAKKYPGQNQPKRASYSLGLEAHYNFPYKEKINFSVGLAYQRVGHGRKDIWRNETPELVERYGKFPIKVKEREFVHYASLPLSVHFHFPNNWFFTPNISLEYPFGISDFVKYKNDNGKVTRRERGKVLVLAFYSHLFSLGAGFQVGKILPMSEKYQLSIGLKLVGYSLLAYRAHDDFRIGREEYPFGIGINIGVLF